MRLLALDPVKAREMMPTPFPHVAMIATRSGNFRFRLRFSYIECQHLTGLPYRGPRRLAETGSARHLDRRRHVASSGGRRYQTSQFRNQDFGGFKLQGLLASG